MRSLLLASLATLCVGLAGCQSSSPAKPKDGDCDCCKTALSRPAPDPSNAFAAADKQIARPAEVMQGIDAAIRVCSSNIQHAGEIGFRSTRVDVNGDGTTHVTMNTEQGSLDDTSRNLDIGIQGDGFFRVKVLNSIGDGFAYTRNGNFFENNQGELVLGIGDGYKLDPPIKLPVDAVEVTISQSGFVEYKQPGATSPKQGGQLQLSQFVNPQGLKMLGGGLYVETESSGRRIDSKVGEDGAGITLQGFLEASNVNVERERLRIEYLRHWRDAVRNAADLTATP